MCGRVAVATVVGSAVLAAAPGTAGAVGPLTRLLHSDRPVYCGSTRKPYVALTFDDGPGPYTALALRILRLAHARATFFLVGKELRRWPRLPAQEARLATLGDHTWHHYDLLGLDNDEVRAELLSAKAAIERAAHLRVVFFRPPYGGTNTRIERDARRLGLLEILWSIDTRDSEGATWTTIAANVERFVRPGSIILMHENRGQTIRALRFAILPYLRRRHLIPTTLTELLSRDPPTSAQLAHGIAGCYGPGRPVAP